MHTRKSKVSKSTLCTLLVIALVIPNLAVQPLHGEAVGESIPNPANHLVSAMQTFLQIQAEVDQRLLAYLDSGVHTFNNPAVVLNPYGVSSLTALALFVSSEPMNISVHVQGRCELTSVDFTFDGYNTRHEIPIFGLYAGQLNTVILTGVTRGGTTQTTTLEIHTAPLPPQFAKDIIQTNLIQPENYQPGFNFTWFTKAAFDVNGEHRWIYEGFPTTQVTLYDYNGHMIFKVSPQGLIQGPPLWRAESVLMFEINKLGRIFNVWHTPHGFCHDLTVASNGNFIVLGHNGDTIEDFIYEIDVNTGEIVNSLDLKRVLQRTRAVVPYFNPSNWFHHNSIEYRDGSIIISGRHQHAIVKMSWPQGEIEWILSDHTGWHSLFHQHLLTPIGDNFEWFYGQHTPTILPNLDGNPDIIDLLLLDNGFARFYNDRELQRAIALGEEVEPENFSRMVHYRINTLDRTVEQIWEWGREKGEVLFADTRSSALMLENGNKLGVFDISTHGISTTVSAFFAEVDALGNTIWEAFATDTSDRGVFFAYRTARLPLYTSAANHMGIGTIPRVLIPEYLLQ